MLTQPAPETDRTHADPRETPEVFERLIELARERVASGGADSGMLRIEMEAGPSAPDEWAWLAQTGVFPKLHFSEREDSSRVAAVGAACVLTGKPASRLLDDAARVLARSEDGVAFYGGARFDSSRAVAPWWEPFGEAMLIVPRWELFRRDGRRLAALNLTPGETAEEIPRPHMTSAPPRPDPTPGARKDEPGFGAWNNAVKAALSAFGSDRLQKTVLARETGIEFETPPCPWTILERLAARAGDCFHFGLQPAPGAPAFVGATPELLFRRRGALVSAEAVAGTRPRSQHGAEDGRLAGQLLSDPKEAREHRFVAEMVGETLRALCGEVRQDNRPKLMQLSGLQHLATRFQAVAGPDVSDADIFDALHPTPAVCGTPRNAALEWLRECEQFDRGWYAGPFGKVSVNETAFSVAIRSALFSDSHARLYAGAGIVPGSDARGEWDELERKIGEMLELLGA